MKVYKSNGSLVQSVCIPTHNQNYKSIFSQSGEYIIVPCELLLIQEEQDHFDQNRSNYPDYIPSTPNSKVFYIYKISKCDYSNQHNMEESKIDANLNDWINVNEDSVISVDPIKSIRLQWEHSFGLLNKPDIFETIKEDNDFCPTTHIDNEGNLIFLNTEWKCFYINDTNFWDDFIELIAQSYREIDEFDIVRFGQGTIVLKHLDTVIYLEYSPNGITWAKQIGHKVLSTLDWKLVNIALPTIPRFIIFFYSINEVTVISVWDTLKDIEHVNFIGRKQDKFLDFILGKEYKLGILCFDKYFANLENCIPIPYTNSLEESNSKLWGQGYRINSDGTCMISKGSVISTSWYMNTHYLYQNASERLKSNSCSIECFVSIKQRQ